MHILVSNLGIKPSLLSFAKYKLLRYIENFNLVANDSYEKEYLMGIILKLKNIKKKESSDLGTV